MSVTALCNLTTGLCRKTGPSAIIGEKTVPLACDFARYCTLCCRAASAASSLSTCLPQISTWCQLLLYNLCGRSVKLWPVQVFIYTVCLLCCVKLSLCSLLVSLVALISLWLISLFISQCASTYLFICFRTFHASCCNHVVTTRRVSFSYCWRMPLFIIWNVQLNGIL